MKVRLTDWAEKHYSPAPSIHTLRRMVRNGEIYPAPEKIGRDYYVEETASRMQGGRASTIPLLQRLQADYA